MHHEKVCKDVLKEECSIVPLKEYANVPRDEYKNITEVEDVQKGRDEILREVTIKYSNSSEQKLTLEGDASKDKTCPGTQTGQ